MIQTDTQTPANHSELSLDNGKRGHSYIITSNAAHGRNRMRMDSLGLIPGDVVHVLSHSFAGLIIAIKGSRLALSKRLASTLTVREFKDTDWAEDGSS